MNADSRARATGVLERIRQGLLDDAVCRDLEGERQLPRVAFNGQIDVQAPLARSRDQVGKLREIGLRGELVWLIGTAQEPEQAMELVNGLTARRFDRAQNLLRLVRVPPHHSTRAARL